MAVSNSAATESAERELTVTRVFDAPRELVWRAWADPDRMACWAGPRGFTMTACEMDSRPGGIFRMSLRSPDGAEHRVRGVYHEIAEGERLVYTWAWVDEKGNSGHETLITVTFADHGEKTKLTLHQALFESMAARDGHRDGWNSAFDCLAEYLATQRRK
ncbi:MAG: SRPBCC domain-containing protein [Candidatus Binataceae bacterium]